MRSTSSAIWQETSRLISVPPSLGWSRRSLAPSDQSQLVTSPHLETQRRHEARAPVVSSVCTNTHVRMKALFCTRPRSYRRAAPFLRFDFVFSCIPAMLACSQACFAWIRVQTLDRAFVPAVLPWRAPRQDQGERLLLDALMGSLDGCVPFMEALDFQAAFGVPDMVSGGCMPGLVQYTTCAHAQSAVVPHASSAMRGPSAISASMACARYARTRISLPQV